MPAGRLWLLEMRSGAAEAVGEKAQAIASDLFEASPEDIELVNGRGRRQGIARHSDSLWDIAVVANPIRYAYGDQAKDAMKLTEAQSRPGTRMGYRPGA